MDASILCVASSLFFSALLFSTLLAWSAYFSLRAEPGIRAWVGRRYKTKVESSILPFLWVADDPQMSWKKRFLIELHILLMIPAYLLGAAPLIASALFLYEWVSGLFCG